MINESYSWILEIRPLYFMYKVTRFARSSQEYGSPMITTHNLGFPRIGARRELKFAQESYWKGESTRDALKAVGAEAAPAPLGHTRASSTLVPVGDFAFYDQVLDMSFTLGNSAGARRGLPRRRARQLFPRRARPVRRRRRGPCRLLRRHRRRRDDQVVRHQLPLHRA